MAVAADSILSAAMTADRTSEVVDLSNHIIACVDCRWGGGSAPRGTIYVQVSNDNTNWVTFVSAGTTYSYAISSGDSGNYSPNLGLIAYKYMRVFYDYTSGTGTLDVTFGAK